MSDFEERERERELARERERERERACVPPAATVFDPAALQKAVAGQVSADAVLLVLGVSTLTPVIQLLMSFVGSSSARHYQAVHEASAANGAGLAAASMAVERLLAPRAPAAAPAREAVASAALNGPYYPPYPPLQVT